MASAIAFLSSCFTSSACETMKSHSIFFNLHRFGHYVSRNKSSDFIFISQVFIPGRPKASLAGLNLQQPGLSTVWRNRISLNASAYRLNAVCSTSLESPDNVPIPIIAIVQDSDYDATIVKLSFGDRLGELNDMMKALLSLGLTVFKGAVSTEGSVKQSTFLIRSEFGHKVEDPDMLEKIRLTIIDTLLKYHPESCEQLAMGELYGVYGLKTQLLVENAPVLQVNEDGPFRSLLYIEMADRPGLLPDLIEVLGHMNFDAKSAEIVTEGFRAKFKIHVSYKGQSITSSMKMNHNELEFVFLIGQALVNCLRYFLRVPETNIDSY